MLTRFKGRVITVSLTRDTLAQLPSVSLAAVPLSLYEDQIWRMARRYGTCVGFQVRVLDREANSVSIYFVEPEAPRRLSRELHQRSLPVEYLPPNAQPWRRRLNVVIHEGTGQLKLRSTPSSHSTNRVFDSAPVLPAAATVTTTMRNTDYRQGYNERESRHFRYERRYDDLLASGSRYELERRAREYSYRELEHASSRPKSRPKSPVPSRSRPNNSSSSSAARNLPSSAETSMIGAEKAETSLSSVGPVKPKEQQQPKSPVREVQTKSNKKGLLNYAFPVLGPDGKVTLQTALIRPKQRSNKPITT